MTQGTPTVEAGGECAAFLGSVVVEVALQVSQPLWFLPIPGLPRIMRPHILAPPIAWPLLSQGPAHLMAPPTLPFHITAPPIPRPLPSHGSAHLQSPFAIFALWSVSTGFHWKLK